MKSRFRELADAGLTPTQRVARDAVEAFEDSPSGPTTNYSTTQAELLAQHWLENEAPDSVKRFASESTEVYNALVVTFLAGLKARFTD